MTGHVIWYAAYGSNMLVARLQCYLSGGRPVGAARSYPGSRDPSPPRDTRSIVLPGSVYFAWESPTWGGGIAFYDPAASGTSAGRAFLLAEGQLSDLLAQEMHREPGADLDLGELLDTGRTTLGPGRYETLHVVGSIDGAPVVTFTASWSDVTHTPPTAAYLTVMGRGLVEGQGWTAERAAAYLLDRPGIGPDWSADAVAGLLG